MEALDSDPEVDQLKASMRTVADVLGNFAMHLRLNGLTTYQQNMILFQWNEWFVEKVDVAHGD